jgi:hypothetical protein
VRVHSCSFPSPSGRAFLTCALESLTENDRRLPKSK